jgi:signal transduction histidine kinase/Tfp pilus assembly protein PilF
MQMIRCILLITCICFSVFVPAQQKRLDSLIQVNKSYKAQDSLKVIHYRNIFRQYGAMRNYPMAVVYVDSAVALAERLKKYPLMVDLYERLGRLFHGSSQYFEALNYYQKAYETSLKYNYARGEAGILLNIGALYMDVKDYGKSLETLQQAIQLNEQLGVMGNVVSSYMNIALVYIELNQIVQALPYLTKALNAFEADDPKGRGVAVASQALATAYMKATEKELVAMGITPVKRYSLALSALNKALPIAFNVDDLPSAATIYADMADIYEASGEKEKARTYFKKAVEIDQQHETHAVAADNLVRIGMHYLRTKERVNGFLSIQKGILLAEDCKSLTTLRTGYEQLSRFYEEANNYDSSLVYYKKFIVIRDSIYGVEKEKEISLKQVSLNYELKERDYKYSKQQVDNELKQQVLLAEQRKNQLALAEKEKSVQRLLFLQQRAKLENEALLQSNAFQQQKDKLAYEQAISKKQIDNQTLEIRFNKYLNLFFLASVIVLIIGGTIIFFSQRRTKKLNQIISDQKDSLQELVHVKDQLLGTISHDMRTPINSLMAFTYLLENQTLSQEKLRVYTHQLKNTLGYTQELLDNLLKWASTQMKGFAPQLTPLELNSILQHALSGFSDSITQKQLKIEQDVDANVNVLADREMLLSVIRNLISNAIKFSHVNGTIHICIGKDSNSSHVIIEDDGIGIADEKLQLINDPVAKLVNSSLGTSQEKGNGLGVLLCKSFVQLMNGSIQFSSEVGKGTRARIELVSVNDISHQNV